MKNLSFCALLSLLPGFVNIQTCYLFPHCFPVQATYGALVVWCVSFLGFFLCLFFFFFPNGFGYAILLVESSLDIWGREMPDKTAASAKQGWCG